MALNPVDGLVITIVNELNVRTEEDLLYIKPYWPEQAAASGVEHPASASVSSWLASLSTHLNWTNAGSSAQHSDDFRQVTGRILRAYKEV